MPLSPRARTSQLWWTRVLQSLQLRGCHTHTHTSAGVFSYGTHRRMHTMQAYIKWCLTLYYRWRHEYICLRCVCVFDCLSGAVTEQIVPSLMAWSQGQGGGKGGSGRLDVFADIKPRQLETGPVTMCVCMGGVLCVRQKDSDKCLCLSGIQDCEDLIERSLKGQSQETDQGIEEYLLSDWGVAINGPHTHTRVGVHMLSNSSGINRIRDNVVFQCNENECPVKLHSAVHPPCTALTTCVLVHVSLCVCFCAVKCLWDIFPLYHLSLSCLHSSIHSKIAAYYLSLQCCPEGRL